MIDSILSEHNELINVYKVPVRDADRICPPVTMIQPGRFEYGERNKALAAARGDETVLLAEDDETLRKLNTFILRQFGYSVVEASDGQEAVDKFMKQKNRISLLVLDVVMPRKSGKDAYREIAALRPGIKAIILSGLAEKNLDLPEKGVLFSMKPIMPKELARSVREVLDRPAGMVNRND